MGEPDIAQRALAAAGALLQLGLVIFALLVWRLGESIVASAGRRWVMVGGRGRADGLTSAMSLAGMSLAATAVIGGIIVLAIWSFAGFWSFPNLLPDQFSMRSWMRHGDGVVDAMTETAIIAVMATVTALFLTIGCLEAEVRHQFRIGHVGTWLLYLPLLIPQTAFLPGLQTLMISLGAEVGRGPVILAHLVFVLPYVYLSLADPFHAVDHRYFQTAAALGASPDGLLWRVRLPMLLRPLLTATAVGVAVSVGQYLPTLLIGGGRVSTLTTEALALASGGDRRAIGVFGLIQTGAALVPFALALLIPVIVWRNRKGLLHD
jgi:putative thiamine transport system permease protein